MGTRVIHCRYCWEPGHNRNGCPKVKSDAIANGEGSHAKDILDRAKVRQCSYCRETTHNLAKCEKKYIDEFNKATCGWSGIQGIIGVIRKRKIAKDALIFGPLTYSYHHLPIEDYQGSPNYEMVNFVIKEISTNIDQCDKESKQSIFISTFAEPESKAVRYFSTATAMPGLYNEILTSQILSGGAPHQLWLDKNLNYYQTSSREILDKEFQVLVPASDKDVEDLVQKFLDLKPSILNYPDAESYRKSVRADKKLANGIK